MDTKQIYGFVLMGIRKTLGKDAAKAFDARVRYGISLNLKHPKSLRDKVIYIENHCPSPLAAQCTDKWAVREYLRKKGLEDLLVPVYGEAWERFEDIPFESFPEKFALKATHGCKMNYFCKDRTAFDPEDCRKKVNQWLKTTYGTYSGEWHYLDIPHRVYCEQYLDDTDKIVDYKFHCMNGVPQFVQVISERDNSGKHMRVKQNLYDMEWHELEGLEEEQGGPKECPSQFREMVRIASILSQDFKYVRVDLYEMKGKVLFGELTFTPANGVLHYLSEEFLETMGAKLQI